MAFGVKTANMFELLGDDEDTPIPSKTVAKSSAETKKAAPELTGAANVEARLKGGVANGPSYNANGRGEGRGGRGRGRGGRGPREGGEGGEGGGEGERAPRPYRGRGAGGRHFERDTGRRGYDRHDGTGRGHEIEKKGGHGGHNWGAPGEEEGPAPGQAASAVWQDDPVEELAAATDAPAAAEAAGDVTKDETLAPAEAPEPAEPEEPEKEEMTLDEYEKQQEEKRASMKKKPTTAVKVDTKAFEGMKAISKSKKETPENGLELSGKKQLGKSKTGATEKIRKEKELLPTGFRIGSNETGGRGRGRGERGGRFNDRFGDRPERERPPRRTSDEGAGGRGGYGRGYGRSDRPFSGGRGRGRDGPPPTIDDNAAFPTLGA